ncbi:non-ribosomal peptide synthetase [uncultured Shewanella sp.]|uniref:non-ribosomal peptide synthetase n=1 Tax=uncultured Shewanella sp. TaxID=173975 RepID=UPI0026163FB2|nr:non-ribosomal peptide synthetase [uncultured Shewanella sp.]
MMTLLPNSNILKYYPLHLAQENIYFESIILEHHERYNIGAYQFINEPLDITVLRLALGHLIENIDSLRLQLCVDSEGVPRQQIRLAKNVSQDVEFIDFSNENEIIAHDLAMDWMNAQYKRAFDLDSGKHFQLALLRLSSKRYYLYSRFHHLFNDGIGVSIFGEYLHRTYHDLLNQNSLDWLKEIPPYRTQVEQSAIYLASKRYQRDKDYWLNFINEHAALKLNRKDKKSDEKTVSVVFPKAIGHSLRHFCQSHHMSLLSVLMATSALYFSEVLNVNEVVIATPVHGRRGKAGVNVVGMHSNVIFIALPINHHLSFFQFCLEVEKAFKKGAKHAQFPFSHLSRLKKESFHSLSDIHVIYDPHPKVENVFESHYLSGDESTTPITIRLIDFFGDAQLTLRINYLTSYYSETEIHRLAQTFITLMQGFTEDSSQLLDNVELVSKEEKHTLLYEWNQTEQPYPKDKTLQQLFEAQVEKTPQHIALVFNNQFEDKQLTYNELNKRANQLAHHIRGQYQAKYQMSLQPDTLIALYFDRSLEMVISILAVLKAGGAYVPIAPEYPKARTVFILKDTNAPFMITQSHYVNRLSRWVNEARLNTCLIQADDERLALQAINNLTLVNQATDLAYVIYTSGTTGQPKGVMIEHSVSAIRNIAMSVISGTQGNVYLFKTNYTFDASVAEIFSHLFGGAKLVITRDCFDLDEITSLVDKYDINACHLVPSQLPLLLENNVFDIENIKQLYFSGEALTQKLLGLLDVNLNRVINYYGPTEAGEATYCEVTENIKSNNHSVIGKPLAEVSAFVLSSHQVLLPIGALGELYIGGAGLARGYLNRPELTVERFITHPFATDEDIEKGDNRLYRTGDLVRYLPDGNLEYFGRLDSQVKVRGYRIELGEIESALCQLEGIKQAIVIDKVSDNGKYLAAYYVPVHGTDNREAALDDDTLRVQLLKALPDYMVPMSFTLIDAVPLTLNGKLNREALPEPKFIRADEYVAPRTELESQLCDIWQAVLFPEKQGLERIGVHDNFFHIGGDSIIAIRLNAKARHLANIDIPLAQLFAYPTIAQLARVLNEVSAIDIPSRTECDRQCLSFAQERLWFIERFERGSDAYNMPYFVKLKAEADEERLLRSINVIAKRHPILISTYHETIQGEGYTQVLAQMLEQGFEYDSHQLSAQDEAAEGRQNALDVLVSQHIHQPFNLVNEPPLRLHRYDVSTAGGGCERYLLFVLHHIAFDGWSIGVFAKELFESYAALAEGKQSNLPNLSISYSDYAHWQRDYLQGEVLAVELNYWRERLAGYETLQLPTDFPRPKQMDYRGGQLTQGLTSDLSGQLRALAQQHDTTLYTVMLSGFYVLLSQLSNQNDLIIGTPSDNRHHPQTQNLIGFFVNSLALRVQLEPELNIQGLIKRVHECVQEAKVHQELPFGKLVSELNIERELSRHSLFQVMFSVQRFGSDEAAVQAAEALFEPVDTENVLFTPAKFDLSVFIDDSGELLKITWDYATSLFSEQSIQRFSDMFQRALRGLLIPSQTVGGMCLLSKKEKHRLLHEWNQTEQPYPKDKMLQQLFEEQVERTPNNIALVFNNQFEDEQLTYNELNKRANQLAHYLRSQYQAKFQQPLQPDTLIALYLDRNLEMIISILAVLKAGGAYVPIAPEYPQMRTIFMLEDTTAAFVITQGYYRTQLGDWIADTELRTDVLEVDDVLLASQLDTNPMVINQASDLAYVIYTSGTTDLPKGVMVEHKSVVNLVHFIADTHKIIRETRALFFSNYIFDASVYEIFPCFYAGATMTIVPKEMQGDTDKLLALINNNSITKAFIPTSIVNLIAEGLAHSSLAVLHTGGEVLDPLPCLPAALVFNQYGPTEATVCASQKVISDPQCVGIGHAIANTFLVILNKQKALTAIGSQGELHIGGAGLARGYLNRPELTAECFINNPFASQEDIANGYTRLYKTGDLVRYLSDGELEYLGRLDRQVKIRGFKIELGEIESALCQLEGIKQAVVIDKESAKAMDKGKYLAAYYVPAHGTDNRETVLDNDTLRTQLLKMLPDYMVPMSFTPIDAVPLTLNGKLDRHALPEPDLIDKNAYVAPRTELEAQLCDIWQAVLFPEKQGLERIGVHDNFFHIGGDSIIAIRLNAKARYLANIDIPLAQLFAYPTIAQLAMVLNEVNAIVIPSLTECDRQCLSFAQERLWFIERFERGSDVYHMPYFVKLKADVDEGRLLQSINVIAKRHPILISTYHETVEGEGYTQVLAQMLEQGLEYDYHSLSVQGEAVEGSNNELETLVEQHIRHPFDLTNEPSIKLYRYDVSTADGGCERYLLILLHHIAFDGWSIGVFAKELIESYAALLEGRKPDLPNLSISYSDYAHWQREYLQGERLAVELNYWRERLVECETLQLPMDFPRPSQFDYRGEQLTQRLTPALSGQLRALAKQYNTTLYTVMLSGFYVLLNQLSHQSDIIVGMHSDNRHHPQTQDLIGFFVNTLPLRVEVDLSMTIHEFILKVNQCIRMAKVHQEPLFDKLMTALNIERDMSRHPLFQVVFSVQQFGSEEEVKQSINQLVEPVVKSDNVIFSPVQYDLRVIANDSEESVSIEWGYATSLFREQSIQRFSDMYQRALMALLVPSKIVGEVCLLSKEEKHMLLHEWNQTQLPAFNNKKVKDKRLQQLFEEQVERTPDNIALVFEGIELTYYELNQRANQLAHYLRGQYQEKYHIPLKPDTLIALYLDRSFEMVISMLAVLKAGGAYVPIAPEYPKARTVFMLNDTNAPFVITQVHYQTKLSEWISEAQLSTSLIQADDEGLASQALDNLTLMSQASDLAYVIYTSGTTGQPKGVMVEHQCIVNLTLHNSVYYNISDFESVLLLSQYVFDTSIEQIALALYSGSRLVLLNASSAHLLDDIPKLIEQFHITHMDASASLLQGLTLDTNNSLKRIISGGEVTPYDLAKKFESKLINEYGPTEITVASHQFKCIDLTYYEINTTPIGRNIANICSYILDECKQLVPIGTLGELYIGGAGLARGYLNRPELTAEHFIDNPFATDEDIKKGYTRLYKTGDAVRHLHDGNLEYLGRLDSQVKIRGYRIELGEIESALCQLEGIKQAVVIDQESDRGSENDKGKYLAAYYVPAHGTDNIKIALDDDTLRDQLLKILPNYMVPMSFTQIDRIPLTLNGKLDRKALPEPEFISSETYVAPRNELEAQLCEIWRQVLFPEKQGLERVGIHDNFFRIGGDSISAIRLSAQARAVTNMDIPLALLFRAPTIAQLSPLLNQANSVIIPHLPDSQESSLSFAQERLWFIERFERGSDLYHMPYFVRLKTHVDEGMLLRSINLIAKRHTVLFSTYHETIEGEGYTQVLAQMLEQGLEYDYHQLFDPIEVAEREVAESEQSELQALVARHIHCPFDLSCEPPVKLYRYDVTSSEDKVERYLLIMLHHIAFDGWSIGVFFKELIESYAALAEGRQPNLPNLSITYSDYARWQREYLQGEVLADELNYWREQLAEYETLQLPTDFSRPEQLDYRGGQLTQRLTSDLSGQLRALAKNNNTTLFTVMLSGFYVLLSQLSNQRDIIIGTPSDNRHHSQTHDLIGFFVNTLAVRVQVEPDLSVQALIERVRSCVQDAKVHQELPFEKLVSEIDVERDLSRHPVFQVMFSVQRFGAEEMAVQAANALFEPVQKENASFTPAKFDLSVFVDDSGESLPMTWEYAISLFTEASIQRFSGMYQRALMGLLAPSQTVGDMCILSKEEKHMLLYGWNQTQAPFPRNKTLQQCFEEQVARTPHNIALVYGDEELTYLELNQKANQLAHYLRGQYQEKYHTPLKPDTLIALYLDRSFEMVISILAVLKAGAAYVPIAPEYPQKRTVFMLKDINAPFVITQLHYQAHLSEWLNNDAAECEQLVVNDEIVLSKVTDNLPLISQASDLAYVIYTSGTTGQPKGVMQPHYNIVRLFSIAQENYHFNQNDVWLAYHAYIFDFSVWELWGSLLYGGKLVIPKREVTIDFKQLVQLCQQRKITVLNQTPSAFNAFSDEVLLSHVQLPFLRYVIFGGDKLTFKKLTPWLNIFGVESPRLINMYGITETTVHVTYKKVIHEDLNKINSIYSSIGRSLSDMKTYILGSALQLLPIEVVGELYIGGAGLARGYLNCPELTAEHFIDNPFASDEDKKKGDTRLYKTGDALRYLPDGNLEYLGRLDRQVKIRGFRIELGEIEAALCQLEGIKQAVVIVQESDKEKGDGKYLAAYYVPVDTVDNINAGLNRANLYAELSQFLPNYMVPFSYTEIDHIPLTLSGKLNTKALFEIKNEVITELPKTELERKISRIFCDILNVENIGVHDNFFACGGNSFLVTKLINRFKLELNKDVTLDEFFSCPTIAGVNDIEYLQISSRKAKVITLGKKEEERCIFYFPFIGGVFPSTVRYGVVELSDKFDKLAFNCVLAPAVAPYLVDYSDLDEIFNIEKFASEVKIESVLSTCVNEIKNNCYNDEYNLVSFCSGCMLNIMVANSLIKEKKKVNKVILINPMNIFYFSYEKSEVSSNLYEYFLRFLCKQFKIDFDVSIVEDELFFKIHKLNVDEIFSYLFSIKKNHDYYHGYHDDIYDFKKYLTLKYIDSRVIDFLAYNYVDTLEYHGDVVLLFSQDDYNKIKAHGMDDILSILKGKVKIDIYEGDITTIFNPGNVASLVNKIEFEVLS